MTRGQAVGVLAVLLVIAGVVIRCGRGTAPAAPDEIPVPELVADAGSDAFTAADAGATTVADDEVAPPPAEPNPRAASIAELLSPGAPALVSVLAEERSGRDSYVLFAYERDVAGESEVDNEDESEGEGEGEIEDDDEGDDESEPCRDEDGNDDAYCDCMRGTTPSIDEGWRRALARPVVRIELARLRERDGVFELLDRATLTDPVIYASPAAPEPEDLPELRVNDIDADGRPEITAIFSIEAPDCDTFQEDSGTLGVLVDGSDLHVQAAFVRVHVSFGGDSDVNTASEETVWRAVDENGDGHADLRVRLTGRSSSAEADDDEATVENHANAWLCPYEVATDRWNCPEEAAHEWLGLLASTLAAAHP